ncbi:MAG: hypothetical protein M3384_05115 [Acidobacteriota bacterium]|nr:hypothetical protein [Acidobacteriota bacterium]
MTEKSKAIEECTETKKDSNILLTENRMKMTFRNPNRKVIKVITVDNCAITVGMRCDYLVVNEKNDEFFVELKGTDIRHACEQLAASIKELSANPTQKAKYSFVISSRVRPAIRTTIQNLQVRFKNNFNCRLIVKNQQYEFEI